MRHCSSTVSPAKRQKTQQLFVFVVTWLCDCCAVFQVFVPVLWQRRPHHDKPPCGPAEEHGGGFAAVLLRLQLCCSASAAAEHLPQVKALLQNQNTSPSQTQTHMSELLAPPELLQLSWRQEPNPAQRPRVGLPESADDPPENLRQSFSWKGFFNTFSLCCRIPLVVELWHKGTTSSDELIGRASIQLSHLLSSEKTRFTGPTGDPSWRQIYQDRIAVVHVER